MPGHDHQATSREHRAPPATAPATEVETEAQAASTTETASSSAQAPEAETQTARLRIHDGQAHEAEEEAQARVLHRIGLGSLPHRAPSGLHSDEPVEPRQLDIGGADRVDLGLPKGWAEWFAQSPGGLP